MLESSRYDGLHTLIAKRDGRSVPGAEPAEAEQLRFVARALERWLRDCPGGPLELGPSGVEAIAAMACCWSAAVTQALAEGPPTLAELRRTVLPALYGDDVTLEHVEALERTGQAEALPGDGGTRYALTEWGMEAIAPLIAAARYEVHFPADDVLPPEILDAEGAFQLATPLLKLPADLHGSCHLSVQLAGEEPLRAGATVEVRRGRVVSSSILLEQDPDTWATGSPVEWCDAVVDPAAAAQLETGGDTQLPGALLEALHERLFGAASA